MPTISLSLRLFAALSMQHIIYSKEQAFLFSVEYLSNDALAQCS